MRSIEIMQVDAFTDKVFGGNPAGVVPSAEGLTDTEMQLIAREMNLSETAFILPSDKADFQIRWFTPVKEVPFCGHATFASLHTLAEEKKFGMDKKTHFTFNIETKVGILTGIVEKSKGSIKIVLSTPPSELREENIPLKEIIEALNINKTDINLSYPIMKDHTLHYLYVYLKELQVLQKLEYDYNKLKSLGNKLKIRGFVIFTTETFENNSDVHSRFFSPYYGIKEDPVTGSAQGPLGVYLVLHKIVRLDNNLVEIKAEQGDIIGRPGRIIVKVEKKRNGIFQTTLISTAITVMKGEILFP